MKDRKDARSKWGVLFRIQEGLCSSNTMKSRKDARSTWGVRFQDTIQRQKQAVQYKIQVQWKNKKYRYSKFSR